MALREKNPNVLVNVGRSNNDSVHKSTRGGRQVTKRVPSQVQFSKLSILGHDDNKENIPPSTFRSVKKQPLHPQKPLQPQPSFLTDKWNQETLRASKKTQLLRRPAPILQEKRPLPLRNREIPLPSSVGNLPPRIHCDDDLKDALSVAEIGNEEDGVDKLVYSYDSEELRKLSFLNDPKRLKSHNRDESFPRRFPVHLETLEGPKQSNTKKEDVESGPKVAVKRKLNFSEALRSNLVETDVEPLLPSQNIKVSSSPTLSKDKSDETSSKRDVGTKAFVPSIRFLTSSGDPEDAEYAEDVLRKMLCDYHEGLVDVPPDGGCFNSVIHAYARLGDPIKAEKVLTLMWQEFHRGNLPPDRRIFTTVMYAWQKSNKEDAPEHCEQLLRQMHKLQDTGAAPASAPDLYSYTCALHCWADAGRKDAAVRAEALFREMLRRYEQGNQSLKPDQIIYSNLMNAFIYCGKKYNDAERILWEMVDACIAGNEKATPSVRSFNTLLAVYAKANVPDKVQEILNRWVALNDEKKIEARPDAYSFSLLLKSWARTNRLDANEKLLKAFEWMKDLYEQGNDEAISDKIKYTTVMSALNRAGEVHRSYDLLWELFNKYQETGMAQYKPDKQCFLGVMISLKNKKKDKTVGKKAENILRMMQTLSDEEDRDYDCDVDPTARIYGDVIFCSRFEPERAERLLHEMGNYFDPSPYVYNIVCDAWRASSNSQKHRRLKAIQAEARQQGIRM